MTPFQAWRHERNAKIANLYLGGARPLEIAAALLCSPTTVYEVLAGRCTPKGHKGAVIQLRKRNRKIQAPRIVNPDGWWNQNGRVVALTCLWDKGHSARTIAKLMRCTRNAVIGKAHRLGLSSRPSPIKRTSSFQCPQALPAPKVAQGITRIGGE